MKSTIGQILLWAGFLSGSLATVFSTAVWSRLGIHLENRNYAIVQSEADSDQLQVDDRILMIDGVPIADIGEINLDTSLPATLTVRRDSGNIEIEVPASADAATLGATGIAFANKSEPQVVGINEQASEAWESGLRTGDVVVSVGDRPTPVADAFAKALGALGDESTTLVYSRDGKENSIQISTGNPWRTINWFWYGLSAAVCIGGIVLIRSGKKALAGQSEKTEASLKQIKAHLGDLVNHTETLQHNLKDLSPREILDYIDDTLHEDFRGFADGRDSITAEHGLEVFAEVMTNFAAGERALNRAWSAAADGYVDEAANCVDRGLAMLKSAQKSLNAA